MDTLLMFIEQFGHYALFLVLCLGVVGLPVPNEVVAMTGGALAASGLLATAPSFFMIYLGLCSGATVGYTLSRYTAGRLLERYADRQAIGRFLRLSERLTRQYGNYAICISAFLPILRNVTPYAVGMKGMKYIRFALFSYAASLIWTTLYFSIGRFLGDQVVSHISTFISQCGYFAFGILAVLFVIALIVMLFRRRGRKKSSQPNFHIDG
ncbi:DedA family protein [Paenibacillus cisolokensis]|uniref:DedA family protein n=1 Tax=Paenibacillus cisolokensis TaxID=1658519 RepID=UPI003D2852B5